MTLRKATLYVGGGSLLVAWFSSAASVSLTRSPGRVPDPQEAVVSPTDGVAGNVQAQARRLKQRLAAAPLPQRPVRNPFAFGPAPVSSRPAVLPVSRAATEAPVAALPPAEPRLELVGIAEQQVDQALVRTAMIATESNELVMAVVGASVLGRYTVTAIASDGVELTDTTTGQARRLVLQPQ
jgi:hypothetical protein